MLVLIAVPVTLAHHGLRLINSRQAAERARAEAAVRVRADLMTMVSHAADHDFDVAVFAA
jgi:hypothetical protein